ncbi:MAG: fructosamine kinase family protein [Myxococcota bacterium]
MSIEQSLGALLGTEVHAARPVAGGDVCSAWYARTEDGREVFAKTHPRGATMFAHEVAGLRWLAAAEAVRIPEVLAHDDTTLVLRWIHAGPRTPDSDAALGRGLAQLHRSGATSFGWTADNELAGLPQDNRARDDWPSFYAQQRVLPLVKRCIDGGRLPASTRTTFERLAERMPALWGPAEPPARLHGDLWSGNAMTDTDGAPVLFDPAVYGGHREIDLAMMQLFGGFAPTCFAAYDEVHPRAHEHEDRVELAQLYPVLVHVALFGGHYAQAAQRIARRYAGLTPTA